MRRRDFTIGLLLAGATAARAEERAQESAKPHRIAIVRPAGSIALISDTGIHFYREFFKQLRRLGDVEGQNLTVERYSGEGKPEASADLAAGHAPVGLMVVGRHGKDRRLLAIGIGIEKKFTSETQRQ